MMLAGRRRTDRSARRDIMTSGGNDPDRARRFRDAALPHLDEAYTLARYILRNGADAEDAVQECYLRALRHFDTFRGGPIRPWLFAILRNACYAVRQQHRTEPEAAAADDAVPLWGEAPQTPEVQMLRRRDDESIRKLVDALPDDFREVIVLREISDLSYRDIAEIIGAPVGTVMSRLARGRAMLRAAWLQAEEAGP
jgi:RNA polymerase sigma-70 factor (ECF subfamily)